MGIFRQEAVARMDSGSAGSQGRADNAVFVQVAVCGFGAADAAAFIRQSHMEGVPIRLGIHRHGGDAHFLAGPDDPHGDLAPVGN